MTSLIDYLLEPETAVVLDIDGVLAVYEFGDLGHAAVPDGDWKSYVLAHDPYASSRPVAEIQDFVRRKGPERVYACSVAQDFEAPGKRAFVCNNYGIPASHVRLVPEKDQKLAFMHEVARELGLPTRRVALVEDTVKTLDAACAEGFTTVHVSSFFGFGRDAR